MMNRYIDGFLLLIPKTRTSDNQIIAEEAAKNPSEVDSVSHNQSPMYAHVMARLLLALSLLGVSVRGAEPPIAVVGYLPEYRIDRIKPDQLSALTDLIYFSIEPAKNGRLTEPLISDKVLEKLNQLRTSSSCRVLVSVGGWGKSKNFPALAAEATARKTFIDALGDFCQTNKLAGVDYDWEHPKGKDELVSYPKLISETRARFQAHGLLVTVAQASWQDLGRDIYDEVDRVHLMSYDHDFPQSTMEKAIADLDQLLGWGCPAHKITLGLPFYGRNQERETKTYHQLIADGQLKPTNNVKNGYAFNGRELISAKLEHVIQHKLGGVMIWEVGQDTTDPETSLLSVIQERFTNPSATTKAHDRR